MAGSSHPERGRIVSVGRLAPQKRHDLLLEAFAQIATGLATRLVLFGNGPLREDLESQARTLGIAHLVDFEGFVDSPAERLHANDVFVLCSDFEGFGNVFVEALARGVRVVATDAPYGARFVLGGLSIAQLVPPGDPGAVANAMRIAIDARAPSEAERQAARATAERFRAERVAADIEELLDDVLLPTAPICPEPEARRPSTA
jgi:glycosyltransferase involved in cell wall biosynthesis